MQVDAGAALYGCLKLPNPVYALNFVNDTFEKSPEMKDVYIREALGYMERSAYTKEELDRYYQWRVNAMAATAMLVNAEAKSKAIGLEESKAIGKNDNNQKITPCKK